MFSPEAEAQLETMRADIQRYGWSIVGCDKLLVFVSATAPIHAQFGHIFTMAEQERWSVEFRPDGTVRFAELQASVHEIREWKESEPDISQAG
jgi:hypothetical protein